jgi:putative ATP-dependent endonuclease of the OLD family
MRVTKLTIKNYRSFDHLGQIILFPTIHSALVGKNNSGKSNIFKALNIVLGSKLPGYIKFDEEDYFDKAYPIEIEVEISDITESDKSTLFSIPGLTKPQKGALSSKVANQTATINFSLIKRLNGNTTEELSEEETKDGFEVKLWGFQVHRKVEDVRKMIIKMLLVPAVRSYQDELSASKWTLYGQLMKEVLENSPYYGDIKTALTDINSKIQSAFDSERKKILKDAKIASCVDDVNFQLTKENNPAELLRNLEVFITEGHRVFNIDHVGTGTQSAIIIGIFELVLKNKNAKAKLFCIEEPETFIHPHGIRYLGSLIKGISSEQNTQVIISTHSLSLVANFEPTEIIRVDKVDGKTIIKQDISLTHVHFRRFVHQDNAEMFFSDRVLFVEGPTEKHLLSNLDKNTILDTSSPDSVNCNFDRINLGVIKLDSVDSIVNYIKIANAFGVEFVALLDKDFITDPSKSGIRQKLCQEVGIVFQDADQTKLISDLKSKNIIINSKGEIEDLFSDQDIANITGKNIADVQSAKALNPKTSKAFMKLFSTGKAEYGIIIADYYSENSLQHPLDDFIRKIYKNDVVNINI